jgi:hypothetical protein
LLLLLLDLPILLLVIVRKVVTKTSCWSLLRLCWCYRATLLFFVVLELSNEPISNLSSLIASLIVLYLSIDHWHVFEICNIIVLDNKNSAANFNDIVYLKWVKSTNLSFSTESKPGSIG